MSEIKDFVPIDPDLFKSYKAAWLAESQTRNALDIASQQVMHAREMLADSMAASVGLSVGMEIETKYGEMFEPSRIFSFSLDEAVLPNSVGLARLQMVVRFIDKHSQAYGPFIRVDYDIACPAFGRQWRVVEDSASALKRGQKAVSDG